MDIASARTLYGTPVVAGIAYGPVAWAQPAPEPPSEGPEIPPEDRENEKERFATCADTVSARLRGRSESTVGTASDILAVAAQFAKDKGWRKAVIKHIDKGVSAPVAAARATEMFADMFRAQGGLMAERVTDLLDMRNRVIAELEGLPEPGIPTPESPVILLAEDLAPADTAGLDPSLIRAIVTRLGGPTSHTSIIARQLGIPCIVAAREIAEVRADQMILVDGGDGRIDADPDPETAAEAASADERAREEAKSWSGPAQTADGEPVQLLANVQDEAGAKRAAASQAQGIGLFRTELSYLNATTEPPITEQTELYRAVFGSFPDSKIVVRTLDAGSDKPVAFASVPDEDNPALGVRGLRTSGIDQGILLRQLDAIAQAAREHGGPNWIMAPMVATISEARWFAQLAHDRDLTAGIMIEVPAAAILIDRFLDEVDFVSIGTNDLTQYVMAADRGNPNLATYTDTWQPAVLNLISHIASSGVKKETPVGVCGEAAADPLLACVFVGMGVTSLSMAVSAIPYVGSKLAKVTMDQCREAAKAVLGAQDPGEARTLAASIIDQ